MCYIRKHELYVFTHIYSSMDNNNYYNYEYESSHGYTQDAYILPYGYTPTDGTSSFNPTSSFTTKELPPIPKDTTSI